MTFITHPSNPTPPLVPGHRQAYPDPTRSAFDVNWTRKEAYQEESAVRSRAYPSPPMSGSPPLPLRPAQEAGSRGSEVPGYYTASRVLDGLRGGPAQLSPGNLREQASSLARPYAQEPAMRSPYAYPRPEESGRIIPYVSQHHHGMPQAISQTAYPTSTPSNSEGYPVPDRPQTEPQPYTSPKSQRKAKGHVASACVPCKKAHLRCDAQRPCSRCLGSGKEDACVDVQHKKRGRPRLRDERDGRFDPSRYSNPQEPTLRRPLSIYPSTMPGISPYEDSLRRNQSYRPLDPPSTENGPRVAYQERPPAPDPNLYTATYEGSPPNNMEPLAYLSMDFDIVKASPMFMEIVHASNPLGNKLSDIVTPHQAAFLANLQNQLFEEQRTFEPNYLPPILGRLDIAIKDYGYMTEDVSRFRLNHLEYFGFVGYDGYTRTFPLRFGLAKEGSFYFIVFLLSLRELHPQLPPPGSSQHSPYPQHPHAQHSQQSQHAQQSQQAQHAQHAQRSQRLQRARDDGSIRSPYNPSVSHASSSSGAPSYTPPQYSASSYQTSQSEYVPASQPQTQPSYQLPPIRAETDHRPSSREVNWSNAERPRRVDIGGLLEQPGDINRR
ncbi:hypothetical protein TRIATDRAFT_34761 [Trichoderma atroviride IMI 206040]|uniref:Zn(2)-C6 fungal-type domain-containing protein n=1 Tax=Hypocrea atroviridis (strain ATCC 20476 / IMI 206040) TaxID=452589 RepID=G9P0N8_HYPAI|nr:uncharacterized protein TRIATDRAFT_34761 [Trichoderma atroviride IMI 206040]EHK43189.1 hypothetical protein TRIATDRAFT_34761 [Trichoderma atroviride IMI 206040]